MSSILLPSRRITNPSGFVEVDRANRFGANLIAGVNGAWVCNALGMVFSASTPGATPNKAGLLNFSGATGNRVEISAVRDLGQAFAIVGRVRRNSAGSQHDGLFDNKRATDWTTSNGVCFNLRSGGGSLFNVGTAVSYTDLTTTFVDGKFHTFAAIFIAGVSQKIYIDKVEVTYTAYDVASGYTHVSTPVAIGSYYDLSSVRSAIADVDYLYAIRGKYTIAELSNLFDAPWQLFKNVQRRIYFDMGAAGGDAVASGSLQGLTLTSPTGTASSASNGTGTGVFAALSLTSPGGSAAGSAVATGSFAYLSLTAPGGSAAGSALATGSPILVSLSVPAGSASGTVSGDGVGTGSVSYISLSNPVGSASGTAVASGSLAALSLSAPSGSAFSGTVASGDISSITLSAPSGYVTVSATATGDIIGFTLSAPTGTASGASPTVARPISDSVVGGWLPSTGSALYPMVDEATPDDADYIYANTLTACKMALNAASGSGGKVVSYRVWSPSSNGVKVRLMCGASLVKEWTHVTLPTTATTYAQSLTAGEIAGITDYSTLSIEMESI